jgi:pilus assembly protein FimV
MVFSRKQVEVYVQHIPSSASGTSRDTTEATGHSPLGQGLRAVAAAVLLASSLTAADAWAMALGRVTVQSQLGQPLRAEIDVPSITDEEAASLQIQIAPEDAFRAATMQYSPVLNAVRFNLERRSNGRTVIRLSSDQAVVEPFLDMVLQATWNGGRLVRGYTMLFDPPNLRPAPAPLLPSTARSGMSAPAPAPTPSATPAPQPAAMPARSAASTPAAPVRPAAAPSGEPAGQVTVKPGDTAGRIALAHKPASASLEQMLVGMLRANPRAFIENNVNRMKAGVVLDLPKPADVEQIDEAEAKQLIAAQSRDFNEYRRRLANMAPSQASEESGRSAKGAVQTEIRESKPDAATTDKLTLSKGAVTSANSQEERIAQQKRQDDSSTRVAELSRNLDELQKLGQAAGATPADPTPTAAATEVPGVAVQAPPPAPPAPQPPTPPAPPPPAPAPAPAAPESSGGIVQALMSNPLALPAAGGLAVLLGTRAVLRLRWRNNDKAPLSEDEDSRFEPAGGQSVDTSEEGAPSSMMYSPSQLDAGGDVDPVAEADVYLAYGRDKQAEEILTDALRLHPDRLPVHLKLLEIHAQRNDTKAFEATATRVFDLTEGLGEDWAQARQMGYALDPQNPLYQPPSTGMPTPPAMAEMPDLDLTLPPESPAASATAEPDPLPTVEPAAEDSSLDFDLDLGGETPAEEAQPVAQAAPAADDGFELDLNLSHDEAQAQPVPEAQQEDHSLDFDLDLTQVDVQEAPALPAEQPAPSPAELPSELDELTLDLAAEPAASAEPASTEPDLDALSQMEVDEGLDGTDPLETKLSLAREFEAIGDTEGARSLAEEVEAEATGALQERARAFLAQLS